jgi:hypothetical protein
MACAGDQRAGRPANLFVGLDQGEDFGTITVAPRVDDAEWAAA